MTELEEYDEELESEEDELASLDESNENPPSDIVAFNELRSCADLFRLYEAKQLDIQPDFQRDFVWPPADQTRFIDSLAKQLPIPSMCISLDYKTDKRQVVDGLQRMSSIVKFLSEPDWRVSKLNDIDNKISNKTVEYIKREYPEIYSRIENTTIPVTVLRCDLSKRTHQEYLFTIFHRLNKGGLKLTNQEIRNCIYSGKFNSLLKEIVSSKEFIRLFSLDPNKKYRYANEELILRILAFAEKHDDYKGPLSKYLNNFMSNNRGASEEKLENLRFKINSSIELLYKKTLDEEPFPRLSKATTEAIFVGIIRNFETVVELDTGALKARYQELRGDALFSISALKEGLAARDRVLARLSRAIEIYGQR